MKILFATGNPYMPEAYGGMQTSADELCRALMRRGHQVAILSRFRRKGLFGMLMSAQKFVLRRKVSRDTRYCYPVWRSWQPWEQIPYILTQERYDVLVIMAVEPVRMALAAHSAKVPIVMLLQDVEFDQHGGDFERVVAVCSIANSRFTAEAYKTAYGIMPTVIFPFVTPELYRVETTRENVTFINPIKQKGVEIALGIAERCPDIPFVFVESWPLSDDYRISLLKQLSALPNVSLIPPQRDMRNIYGKCHILLAPSQWKEGFGRVASEAQISGIPVVASRQGGLAEAVGEGGVLIDPDAEIDLWVDAVRTLWSDPAAYSRLSAAALLHAQRPQMNFEWQIDAYEAVFAAAADAATVTVTTIN